MREKIEVLVTQIHNTINEVDAAFASLATDLDKVEAPLGNNKANARISTSLLQQSLILKALGKACYATRQEVIAYGKEKKAVRAAQPGPKPVPPTPKPAVDPAAAPPPPYPAQ